MLKLHGVANAYVAPSTEITLLVCFNPARLSLSRCRHNSVRSDRLIVFQQILLLCGVKF